MSDRELAKVTTELCIRAKQLLSSQGKLTNPFSGVRYITTGKYTAAIQGGIIKVGLTGVSHPFLSSNQSLAELAEVKGLDEWREVLQEFRDYMVLDDLSSIDRSK